MIVTATCWPGTTAAWRPIGERGDRAVSNQRADATLKDVKERLAKTRFLSEIDNSYWDYGTNLAYLKELVTYWRTTFNWREQERRLNQLPAHDDHRRRPHSLRPPAILESERDAAGDDSWLARVVLRVHESDRPSHRADAQFWRQRQRRLSCRRRVPARLRLLGKARTGGYGPTRMARTVAQLMARLGYTRHGAQGGDWGASIVRQLGLVDPHLIGLHSNMCLANACPGPNPNEGVPAEDLKRVQAAQARSATELGYFQINRRDR